MGSPGGYMGPAVKPKPVVIEGQFSAEHYLLAHWAWHYAGLVEPERFKEICALWGMTLELDHKERLEELDDAL